MEDNDVKCYKSHISQGCKIRKTFMVLVPYKFQLDSLWHLITKSQIQGEFCTINLLC